ncbi:MAG TPA: ABC transporter ATP-binding protein [Gemmatimonadales bacterium]|nr:ABC transporter ATP-binding protein [Gemmatimonadales bacterium]
MTRLLLDSVSFGYGQALVLDGISLQVGAGEGVALLGPNGAGKTTLTRLAMALQHPRGGQVVTVGRNTRRLRPEDLADVAGYLFQHPESQLFARTVRAEVGFGPAQLRWAGGRAAAAVDQVLSELGLASVADAHPYDLPGPTRRLVGLAAALVCGPPLLVLDEPTAGLDRASRTRVAEVLLARRAGGTAVLAVTHDLEFAAAALDRGLLLVGGQVARDIALGALLGHHPEFPAPPLVDLSRQLGFHGVRPTVAVLSSLLTSHPQTGTLEA